MEGEGKGVDDVLQKCSEEYSQVFVSSLILSMSNLSKIFCNENFKTNNNLKEIIELDLSKNQLKNITDLHTMPNLVKLNLESNKIEFLKSNFVGDPKIENGLNLKNLEF